uniref:Uncharacterized protein n=1 Tax=Setaria italica TaxID=4555 RepID=K3ZGL4_SETIT
MRSSPTWFEKKSEIGHHVSYHSLGCSHSILYCVPQYLLRGCSLSSVLSSKRNRAPFCS